MRAVGAAGEEPGSAFPKRFIVLLVLLLVGLSFVYSTDYERARTGAGEGECAPNCSDVRFLARDSNPDDGIRVLRDDPAFGNLRLALGRGNPGTERVYKAAFAVSNEEPFPVDLNSVTLTGVAANWVTLTLHRSSNRFAAQDTGASLVIWDGPGADAPGVPHPFSWTLAAGDMNMATAGVLAEYSVAGPDPASNTRYISNPGIVQGITGAGANKDFVWVQVGVRVPAGTANGLYPGDVQFVFDASPSSTTQYGRTQSAYSVQVARNWYFRDAFSCAGGAVIRASAFDPDNELVYFVTAGGGFCSLNTLYPNQGASIPGLAALVGQPRAMAFNPVDRRIYIAGDDRDFAAYDPLTGVLTPLEASITGIWPAAAEDILAMTVDPVTGAVYLAGDDRNFIRRPLAGAAVNLEGFIPGGFWPAGDNVNALAFNPVNGLVYLAGQDTDFVSYNPGTNGVLNHAGVLTGFYPAGDDMFALAVDAAGFVYVGGQDRDLARFNPAGPSTNLEPGLAGIGWGPVGADIRALAYQPATNQVYIGGQNGEYARYNVAPATLTDLQAAITGWGTGGGGGFTVNTLAIQSLDGRIYIGGGGGRLFVHDPALGIGAASGDDLRGRRLLAAPPAGAVTSVSDPIAVGTQQIDDGANPTESWSQVPKFAAATALAGGWTFSFYGCRSAAGIAGSIQARVFRISDGALLATSTGPALAGWPVCGGTGLLTWSPVLAAMPVMAAGDGFFVQVWVIITAAPGGASVTMRFDGAANPSGVVTP